MAAGLGSVRVVTETQALPANMRSLAIAKENAGSRITLSDSGSGFLWFKRTGEIKVILPPYVARDLSVTVNDQDRSLANAASLDQSSSPRPTAT
ncbi:hypothetical protein [Mycobacterium neglectum]|uniref:hypothetical protein n=1 Tax=Mycobacterium neglectum TaxID=242737 RepID=UPI001145AFA0|nr:hypothetical protein [Mycobacterium neglectum]